MRCPLGAGTVQASRQLTNDSGGWADELYYVSLVALLVLRGDIEWAVLVKRDLLRSLERELTIRSLFYPERGDRKRCEPQPFTDREAQRHKNHERDDPGDKLCPHSLKSQISDEVAAVVRILAHVLLNQQVGCFRFNDE